MKNILQLQEVGSLIKPKMKKMNTIIQKYQNLVSKYLRKIVLEKIFRIQNFSKALSLVVMLPDTFKGMGAQRNSVDPTIGKYPKVWVRGQNWKK